MADQVQSQLGGKLTGEIIYQRSWMLSAILQAETTVGRFFLKCAPPLWNDAAYTEALARLAPSYVAAPVAVDTARYMMVTANYGEILDPHDLSKTELECLTTDFTRLQFATIGRAEELIAAGLPDCRLPRLLEYFDEIASCPVFKSLENTELSTGALNFGPPTEAIEFFVKNTAKIKTVLRRLEAVNLPDVVLNNDLGHSNTYAPTGSKNYMFFDFGEGYVGNPLAPVQSGLDEKRYQDEWALRSTTPVDDLRALVPAGYLFSLLAMMMMRLQDAKVSEFPEQCEYLDHARFYLHMSYCEVREMGLTK